MQLAKLEEEMQRLGRLLNDQQGRYEQLKIKSAAYCRQAEQRAMSDTGTIWAEPAGMAFATDEEVELELMRCKEAFAKGGAR